MGLLQMGPSGTLCGRGQPCALLVEGVSLPYLNWFWLLQSSAVYHLGNSYTFLLLGFGQVALWRLVLTCCFCQAGG